MLYPVRIKNSMYGYETDYVVWIEADSPEEAIAVGQKRDIYAEVTINPQKDEE